MALNNNNKNSLITNPHICTARLEKFKITHSTYKLYRDPLQRVITGSLWDLVHNLILETPNGAENTAILVGERDFKLNIHFVGLPPFTGAPWGSQKRGGELKLPAASQRTEAGARALCSRV